MIQKSRPESSNELDVMPSPAQDLSQHVGIFWEVPHGGATILVTDSVPLAEAEVYGDCLTHPRGHYEV